MPLYAYKAMNPQGQRIKGDCLDRRLSPSFGTSRVAASWRWR